MKSLGLQRGLLTTVLLAFSLAGCGRTSTPAVDLPVVQPTRLEASHEVSPTYPAPPASSASATPPGNTATATPTLPTLSPKPTLASTVTLAEPPTPAVDAPLSPSASSQAPTIPTKAVSTVTGSASPSPVALRLERTENYLVLGADTRPGPWMMHTDSIMLIAVDRQDGQVGILSIPRDLWVDIPGWGQDRINATYFLGSYTQYPGGGPALARRVAEETLGVPIEHVALIKMDGLARLVDALGGVTVTLDCPLYEQTPDPQNPNHLLNWSLPAGEVLLDGASAKKFVTYRYLQSDFARARRQQQLIWAIRNQAAKIGLIPKIPELWKGLSAAFETDLSLLDMIGLARFGLELKPENVRGAALDHDVVKSFVTSGGAAVLVIKDPASLTARLGDIFSSKPLAELGKNASGKCPPPPPGFAKPASTPAAGVTPSAADPTPAP